MVPVSCHPEAIKQTSVVLSRPVAETVSTMFRPPVLFEQLYASTSVPSLQTRNRIARIRTLRDGWAGPSSIQIDELVLQRAVSALEVIAKSKTLPDPEITPNDNGTISFEWENANLCIYLEIGKTRVKGFIQSKFAGLIPLSYSEPSVELFEGFSEILNPSDSSMLSSSWARP
jgi:hypothetical protein